VRHTIRKVIMNHHDVGLYLINTSLRKSGFCACISSRC